MLKDRKLLEQYLVKKCDLIVLNANVCKEIYTYAHETYGIPKSTILDLICARKELSEVSEWILFILLDSMCEKLPNDKVEFKTEYFFTQEELENFKELKYETEKIKFPLKFKMIEIEKGKHWIGKITVNELMKIRQAQLISYNVDTPIQKVVNNPKEIWKPEILYTKTVKEIQSSLEEGIFIPSMITLNIPTDTKYDFYYDNEDGYFVIKELECFKIIGGYDQYIATCGIKDKNPKFDYLFELRILNFEEDKVKHFIFQDEQKTRIRKIDLNSMNMNNAANIVTERLNESEDCLFKGLIDRSNEIIPFAEFAVLVDYFYFKKIKKTDEQHIIEQTTEELKENFNALAQYDDIYLKQKMNYKTLATIMFCFIYLKDKNVDKEYVCEIIGKTLEKMKIRIDKFRNHKPNKVQMSIIEDMVKEVI